MNVLCFGDSNTFGKDPFGIGRLSNPWPSIVQANFPEDVVISDGLYYRTFVVPTVSKKNRAGILGFTEHVASQDTLDYAFVMLGSNDLRSYYNLSESDLFTDAMQYSKVVGGLGTDKKPELVYVVPAYFGHEIEDVRPGQLPRWKEKIDYFYNQLVDLSFNHIDARDLAVGADQIHITQKSHNLLAQRVSEYISGCAQ